MHLLSGLTIPQIANIVRQFYPKDTSDSFGEVGISLERYSPSKYDVTIYQATRNHHLSSLTIGWLTEGNAVSIMKGLPAFVPNAHSSNYELSSINCRTIRNCFTILKYPVLVRAYIIREIGFHKHVTNKNIYITDSNDNVINLGAIDNFDRMLDVVKPRFDLPEDEEDRPTTISEEPITINGNTYYSVDYATGGTVRFR